MKTSILAFPFLLFTRSACQSQTQATTWIANNDFYVVMNVASRTVLDLSNGDPSGGTHVTGWDPAFNGATANQVWQFESEGLAWRLRNRESGTYMDLQRGNGNGDQIVGQQREDSDTQLWYPKLLAQSGKIPIWSYVVQPLSAKSDQLKKPDRIRNKVTQTNIDNNDGSNKNGYALELLIVFCDC